MRMDQYPCFTWCCPCCTTQLFNMVLFEMMLLIGDQSFDNYWRSSPCLMWLIRSILRDDCWECCCCSRYCFRWIILLNGSFFGSRWLPMIWCYSERCWLRFWNCMKVLSNIYTQDYHWYDWCQLFQATNQDLERKRSPTLRHCLKLICRSLV